MDLEPARQRRVGRLVAAEPASTRRQPSASTTSGAVEVAAVGVHDVAGAAVHLRGLELEVALVGEQLRRARGSRRSRTSRAARSARAPCGVWMTSSRELLAVRSPSGRAPRSHSVGIAAGRGLALADLVAVDHQHARARARELARHGQPGEARAADQDVAVAARAECDRRRAWSPAARVRGIGAARPTLRAGRCLPPRARIRERSRLTPPRSRRGIGRTAARDRRSDRPELRRHPRPLRGGRRRVRARSSASTRTRSWSTSATRARASFRSNELSIRKSVDPHDEVELGEEVDALVLTKEDQDGRLILSKKRARFEKAWRRIEAAAESGEPVEGTVIEVVKGGLIIDLGVRGFLPASLVDIRRVQNLDEFLGTKIECKVIELNRSRNNVVLSPPRGPRGGAQGGPPADPRPPPARPGRGGRDLEHRRLRRVRRPRRHRRPDPHLRALLEPREPPVARSSRSATSCRSRCSTSTATASASPSASSRPRRTRGSGWSTPTASATSSRARSPRSSPSARSSRSWTASRGSCTSPSSPSTTSRTRARSSSQGDDVRVKILEIDSERRRLSLSVKRVEEQLAHIKSAAEAGAAAAAEAGAGEDLGDVPDLGLSEDVFAGPSISGADALRAALPPQEEPAPAEEPVARRRLPRTSSRGAGRGGAPGSRRSPVGGGACRRGACRGGARCGGARRGGARRRAARGRAGPGRGGSRARRRHAGRGPRRSRSGRRAAPGAVAWPGPVPRAHRRHRRRQVRGAARARRARRGHALHGRRRARAARERRAARRSWSSGSATGWRRTASVDRALIAERVFGDDDARAWLEGELWPRVGARVAEWRATVDARRAGRRAPPWSRCRSCSSPGWTRPSTRRSPWSPTRPCAPSARAPAATRRSPSAPRGSSRRTRRPSVRTSRSATTAPSRS